MEKIIYGSLFILIALLNLRSCYLFYKDKQLARAGAYRISEKKLLQSSFLLGGIGAFLAMNLFRHKTQHMTFKILIPLALVFNLVVYALIFNSLLS
ncbi:DUF1294 domain-containing protein [Aerococcaceae bacterium WGS1372]